MKTNHVPFDGATSFKNFKGDFDFTFEYQYYWLKMKYEICLGMVRNRAFNGYQN